MLLPGNIFKIKKGIGFNVTCAFILISIIFYLLTSIVQLHQLQFMQNQFKNIDQFAIREMYKQIIDPIEKKNIDVQSLNAVNIFSDNRFIDKVHTYPFRGDQISIENTKKQILSIQNIYSRSAQNIFGFSPHKSNIMSSITYLFTHGSFIHLMANMLFLFLVGSLVERKVGSLLFSYVFLVSGFISVTSYMLFQGLSGSHSALPVVGSSGAICGLMSFLVIVKGTKNISWSYFIFWGRKGYGVVYLPAYLIFPLFLIADFTQVLIWQQKEDWAPALSSGVAYAAHVGGTLIGLLLGLFYLKYKTISDKLAS